MMTPDDRALWQALRAAGLTGQDAPPGQDSAEHWTVHVLGGMAAWVVSLFLLGFLLTSLGLFDTGPVVRWVLGALMLGGAALMLRGLERSADPAVWAQQSLVAGGLAGEALLTWAAIDSLPGPPELHVVWISALGYSVLTPLVARLVNIGLLSAAGFPLLLLFGWGPLVLPLYMAVAVVLWLGEYGRAAAVGWRLLAYGTTVTSLLAVSGLGPAQWVWRHASDSPWPDWAWQLEHVALGGLLCATAAVAARQCRLSWHHAASRLLLALVLVTAGASWWAPGLAIALSVVLIGLAHRHRILLVIGLIALLGYLARWYDMLDTSLLEKSILMLCSGATLLVVNGVGRLQRRASPP